MSLYFSIAITIIGLSLYHVCQSSISSTANPIVSLIITYFIAIIISLVILVLFPPKAGIAESFKQLNWASFALALAVVGVEIGYLLAYRFGWSVSIGSIIPHVVVAMLVMTVESLVLKKGVTITNLAGLLFCTIGMIFVNRE